MHHKDSKRGVVWRELHECLIAYWCGSGRQRQALPPATLMGVTTRVRYLTMHLEIPGEWTITTPRISKIASVQCRWALMIYSFISILIFVLWWAPVRSSAAAHWGIMISALDTLQSPALQSELKTSSFNTRRVVVVNTASSSVHMKTYTLIFLFAERKLDFFFLPAAFALSVDTCLFSFFFTYSVWWLTTQISSQLNTTVHEHSVHKRKWFGWQKRREKIPQRFCEILSLFTPAQNVSVL